MANHSGFLRPSPSIAAHEVTGQQSLSCQRTEPMHSGRSELEFEWDMGGLFKLEEDGIESEDAATARYSIVEGDPLSARVRCRCTGWPAHGSGPTSASSGSRRQAPSATQPKVTPGVRAEAWGAGARRHAEISAAATHALQQVSTATLTSILRRHGIAARA